LARGRGIETIELPAPPGRAAAAPLRSRLPRARVGGLVRRLRRARPRSGEASGLTLVLATFSPDRDVIEAWVEVGGRVVEATALDPGHPDGVALGVQAIWDAVARDEHVRGLFAVDGVDLFELAESRIAHLVLDVLPRHVAAGDGARRLLRACEQA